MRSFLAAMSALLLPANRAVAQPGEEDVREHSLVQNKMIAVTVERAVYETRESDRFFIRVTVRNRTKRTIGVDLRGYHDVIGPNQWTSSEKREREIIDEARSRPKAIDANLRGKLLAGYRAKKLTPVPAGKSVAYFRDFNGNAGKAAIRARAGKNLIISLDGQLIATDGKSVSSVDCQWNRNRGSAQTDLVIPSPLPWRTIPAKAIVVQDQN